MATESKQSEIYFQRSSAWHHRERTWSCLHHLLLLMLVTQLAHTTKAQRAWSHLTLPVEYVQYGIHGTMWSGPKPRVQSNNSLSLLLSSVYGALLHRDFTPLRCRGNWHIFAKHNARLWPSRNTPNHPAPWKTVLLTLKEIKSNICIGHTLKPLHLFLTF